jgi:hypothetical protein
MSERARQAWLVRSAKGVEAVGVGGALATQVGELAGAQGLRWLAGGTALAGVYLGAGRLPQRLVNLLESSPKGHAYLIALADGLLAAYLRRWPSQTGDPDP